MVKYVISEGLLFEIIVLITMSLLLLWTLRKVSIENLPLTMEEVHIFYEGKITSLENAILLRARSLSEEYAMKVTRKISLSIVLAKLRRLCRRKRDYVVIGKIYEKIHCMVSERK